MIHRRPDRLPKPHSVVVGEAVQDILSDPIVVDLITPVVPRYCALCAKQLNSYNQTEHCSQCWPKAHRTRMEAMRERFEELEELARKKRRAKDKKDKNADRP